MRCIATVLVMLLLASHCRAVQAAEETPPYFSIRQDVPTTGSNIKRRTVSSNVLPLNKRYGELSAEQQAYVRAQYESMGPNDEPPFPLDGLGPIYKMIADGQQSFLVTGSMSLAVEISGQGEATSVSVLQSPDPELTKFVASVLMFQKYKPALCNGTPCTMQFPFRIAFDKRL